MKMTTEITEKKQKMLIVGKKEKELIKLLKSELLKYQIDVFVSPDIPRNLKIFNHCFLIGEEKIINNLRDHDFQKITMIFISHKKKSELVAKFIENHKIKNIKVINISHSHFSKQEIDKILWFAFSKDQEIYLNLAIVALETRRKSKDKIPSFDINFFIKRSKKKIILFLIFFVILSQIIFIPFLFVSSFLFYKSSVYLKNSKINEAKKYLVTGDIFFNLSKKLYQPSRALFAFLSLAILPDNLIDINNKLKTIINQSINTYKNAEEITRLILNHKSKQDRNLLKSKLTDLKTNIGSLEENVYLLNQKLPENITKFANIKKELLGINEALIKAKVMLKNIDYLLGADGERKYLLLFANNMELRPGGGFIGSFGLLTFKDYTFVNLQVYDVYDADGQLKAHVDPPIPIKTYMNQPHWFFRDSAFSPDYLENYTQAKYFLKKEMNLDNFSGGILITTTTIQNILNAFGDIYLTDYREVVNSKNYYLKTQLYAEKNFFPGSTQKKTFLSSLVRHILINLEEASPIVLFENIKKSLDEKQLVMYFDNEKVQSVFDSFSWSGRIVNPLCSKKITNCFVDYLYPYDANLGVNKANFFISKLYNLKVKMSQDGKITNILSIKFVNDSPNNVFPGGNYHNYFQTLLSANSSVKKITKNGVLVENYDEKKTEKFNIIGFLLDVAPKSSADIKIEYTLDKQIEKGRGIYQLTIQKQIGSFADDFVIELSLPENIYLLNQNFSPLVKNNRVIYNTILSTDKFFLLELIRE